MKGLVLALGAGAVLLYLQPRRTVAEVPHTPGMGGSDYSLPAMGNRAEDVLWEAQDALDPMPELKEGAKKAATLAAMLAVASYLWSQ